MAEGIIAPGHVTALAPREGRVDLFGTGPDGTVWSTWWDAESDWQSWFPVRPGLKLRPGATVTALAPRDGHVDLFGTTTRSAVLSTWWEANPAWQNRFFIA